MSRTKVIKPENTFKKKVGNGGFKDSDLVKAQEAIENNKVDFKPIAQDFLEEIAHLLEGINSQNINSKDIMGKVMYPMMQLRAQGALFHYPSITQISDIVVDFLDHTGRLDSDVVKIISAYKKSVNALLSLDIKDAAQPINKQLCSELTAVCQRYSKAQTGQ